MKIYLDINGTIIFGGKPAPHLRQFLQNALAGHEVYWLSTMCDGNREEVISYLQNFLPQDMLELSAKVKPTSWHRYKIEAIDLSEDFLWFDDTISLHEINILKEAGRSDSFVKVDHYHNNEFFKDWVNI